MNVYENCPVFENEAYLLRLVKDSDTDDLLKVYSDEKAVPFFNGDNCHGDDFHYTTRERMAQAVEFWKESYKNGWFVRWAVIDKRTGEAVGTIENFHRDAGDFFTNCGLLRLDLRSDHETADDIRQILSPILPPPFLYSVAIRSRPKRFPPPRRGEKRCRSWAFPNRPIF